MKDQKNRMVNERDFRQDPNYVAPDKEKEKLILQLGTMITDRYLVKYSRRMIRSTGRSTRSLRRRRRSSS